MATYKNTLGDWGWIILIVGVLCVITYNNSYNKKLDEAKQQINQAKGIQQGIQQEQNRQWHRDFVMQQLSPQATPQQEANRRSMNEFLSKPCSGCGGVGSYRFVAPDGRLIVRDCPYCWPR
jgi:hypothetical protein